MPSRFEISDERWAEVEPLIPARPRRRRYPGRKAIDDRLVLNGILHVLHSGIAWADLPREYGYGSGHNFRRLRTRYERDPEIHEAFLSLACAILCFRRLQSF